MHSYTILYAEDEENIRLNYTNFLKKHFKSVYSVDNGKDALKIYKKYNPDILLLDINMPIINGLEVARQIREDNNIVRIIILTAHLEQDKLLFATELNLTKYLPKPISRIELKDTLNKAIKQLKNMSKINDFITIADDFIWNKVKCEFKYKNLNIKLTKNEILLFKLLCSHSDRIFTIDEIAMYLFSDNFDSQLNTRKIKDIIKRVRKKLPYSCVKNIYGAGYKLELF